MFKKLKIYVPRINICFLYANIYLENLRIYVRKIGTCFTGGNISFEKLIYLTLIPLHICALLHIALIWGRASYKNYTPVVTHESIY